MYNRKPVTVHLYRNTVYIINSLFMHADRDICDGETITVKLKSAKGLLSPVTNPVSFQTLTKSKALVNNFYNNKT